MERANPPASFAARLPEPLQLLGAPLHPVDLAHAAELVLAAATDSGPARLIVTLNPEILLRAQGHPELATALAQADLSVPDGIGVLWAAGRAGLSLRGRVPGVELSMETLKLGGPKLRVFFLGGRPGVAEAAAAAAQRRWGISVAGCHDGYFDIDAEGDAVVGQVAASGAQLLLAGLGERQELFLHKQRDRLGVGAMMGVGGTLDVLAGTVKRTPPWTHRVGLEWAWRIGSDPKRWYRFPRLVAFVVLVLRRVRRGSAGS
jgi:N-acetylglucosaminyldiphosphoundecaprenol N-acetyl-beta-D-mannosaminyltransferase